jgi:hypothetical protein
MLALTILAAIFLGVMIFVSHAISFIVLDSILKWLIPISLGLLTVSIVCICVVLGIANRNLIEDVQELRYSWSLIQQAIDNGTPSARLVRSSPTICHLARFSHRDRLLARTTEEPNQHQIRRQSRLVLRHGGVGAAFCLDHAPFLHFDASRQEKTGIVSINVLCLVSVSSPVVDTFDKYVQSPSLSLDRLRD